MFRKLILLITLLIVAACQSTPSQTYTVGDTLLSEDFSEADAWEFYVDEDTQVDLQVIDGAYRIRTADAGYIWGLNEQEHRDVVMEVTTSQASSFENNAYGLMCRADISNNGDGYYFLISADGGYSIARGEGDDVVAIIDWTESSEINQGQAINSIRAVCIGDYLALYVNDTFVADTNDSTYAGGYAGFAAAAFEGGNIDIRFDNLRIQQASLDSE